MLDPPVQGSEDDDKIATSRKASPIISRIVLRAPSLRSVFYNLSGNTTCMSPGGTLLYEMVDDLSKQLASGIGGGIRAE